MRHYFTRVYNKSMKILFDRFGTKIGEYKISQLISFILFGTFSVFIPLLIIILESSNVKTWKLGVIALVLYALLYILVKLFSKEYGKFLHKREWDHTLAWIVVTLRGKSCPRCKAISAHDDKLCWACNYLFYT